MVLKDVGPYFSFGVMGGDFQPQGTCCALLNPLVFGMKPQEAGECAPATRRTARCTSREVWARGSDVFRGYQGILIDHRSGIFIAGSDNGKEGCAVG
jgi:gamma-glutamyltranspeptidase/glutathione hydrolase